MLRKIAPVAVSGFLVAVIAFAITRVVMSATEIPDVDIGNLNAARINRLLRSASWTSPAVQSDQHAIVVVLSVSQKPTQEQLNNFCGQITQLAGVQACVAPIHGKAPPASLVPVGSEIRMVLEGRFRLYPKE